MPEIIGSSKSISGFDPRSVGGCIIWNDASATTTPAILNLATNGGYTISCTGTVTANAKNGLNAISLTTAQTWTLSPLLTLSAYTMFWVGRQTGGTNRRVLQGSANNQLFGYWNGYKKAIYISADPNQLFTQASDTAWDLMSHSRTAGGPYTFNWNGSLLFSAASSTGNPLYGLSINTGESPVETSDCQFGEIIVYNSVLSSTQIRVIESYLSTKWAIALSGFYPYSKPAPLVRGFNPIDIPGCQLWLDAADPTSVTGTTSVTAWRDKSGNGRNLGVGSGTTSYANNAITLNSSYMFVTSAVDLTNFTFFIVSKSNGAVNNQTVFGARPNTSVVYNSTDGFGFYMDYQSAIRFYGQTHPDYNLTVKQIIL